MLCFLGKVEGISRGIAVLCFERISANDHRNSYARTAVFMKGITRTLNFTTNIRVTDRALF